MKKTVLLLASLMFLATFTSCFKDKDGEYKPKEKISRIFYDYGDGKELREVWNWDNKLLKSIDHYSGGSLDWTEEFTYNKKDQVERVDCYAYGEYAEYTYDGSELSKVTYYEDNSIELELSFKYDGKTMSEIEVMYFDYKRQNRLLNEGVNPLRTMLAEKPYKELQKIINQADSREIISVKLEWENKNISKMVLTEGAYTETYEFEYDDKLSPFTNLYGLYSIVDIDLEQIPFCKNNVTQIRETESYEGEVYTDTEKYSYSYDGKFPTVKRHTYSYKIGGYYDWVWNEYTNEFEEVWIPEETVTHTTSTYYEYE